MRFTVFVAAAATALALSACGKGTTGPGALHGDPQAAMLGAWSGRLLSSDTLGNRFTDSLRLVLFHSDPYWRGVYDAGARVGGVYYPTRLEKLEDPEVSFLVLFANPESLLFRGVQSVGGRISGTMKGNRYGLAGNWEVRRE